MALKFRNLNVTPADTVDRWGVEGILTALERGGVSDWRRVESAVRVDPFGEVAEDSAQAIACIEDPRLAGSFERQLFKIQTAADPVRAIAAAAERAAHEAPTTFIFTKPATDADGLLATWTGASIGWVIEQGELRQMRQLATALRDDSHGEAAQALETLMDSGQVPREGLASVFCHYPGRRTGRGR